MSRPTRRQPWLNTSPSTPIVDDAAVAISSTSTPNAIDTHTITVPSSSSAKRSMLESPSIPSVTIPTVVVPHQQNVETNTLTPTHAPASIAAGSSPLDQSNDTHHRYLPRKVVPPPIATPATTAVPVNPIPSVLIRPTQASSAAAASSSKSVDELDRKSMNALRVATRIYMQSVLQYGINAFLTCVLSIMTLPVIGAQWVCYWLFHVLETRIADRLGDEHASHRKALERAVNVMRLLVFQTPLLHWTSLLACLWLLLFVTRLGTTLWVLYVTCVIWMPLLSIAILLIGFPLVTRLLWMVREEIVANLQRNVVVSTPLTVLILRSTTLSMDPVVDRASLESADKTVLSAIQMLPEMRAKFMDMFVSPRILRVALPLTALTFVLHVLWVMIVPEALAPIHIRNTLAFNTHELPQLTIVGAVSFVVSAIYHTLYLHFVTNFISVSGWHVWCDFRRAMSNPLSSSSSSTTTQTHASSSARMWLLLAEATARWHRIALIALTSYLYLTRLTWSAPLESHALTDAVRASFISNTWVGRLWWYTAVSIRLWTDDTTSASLTPMGQWVYVLQACLWYAFAAYIALYCFLVLVDRINTSVVNVEKRTGGSNNNTLEAWHVLSNNHLIASQWSLSKHTSYLVCRLGLGELWLLPSHPSKGNNTATFSPEAIVATTDASSSSLPTPFRQTVRAFRSLLRTWAEMTWAYTTVISTYSTEANASLQPLNFWNTCLARNVTPSLPANTSTPTDNTSSTPSRSENPIAIPAAAASPATHASSNSTMVPPAKLNASMQFWSKILRRLSPPISSSTGGGDSSNNSAPVNNGPTDHRDALSLAIQATLCAALVDQMPMLRMLITNIFKFPTLVSLAGAGLRMQAASLTGRWLLPDAAVNTVDANVAVTPRVELLAQDDAASSRCFNFHLAHEVWSTCADRTALNPRHLAEGYLQWQAQRALP